MTEYDTAIKKHPFLVELRDLRRYQNLVVHLIRRNITARYKRSFLGIGWTLLDPLLTMIVMVLVYSSLFRTQIEGFAVFVLCGIVVWNYFSQASSQSMTDIMYSGSLLGRVFLPKSVFAVSATGTGLVHFLIACIPLVVFMVIYDRPITLALLFLPLAVVILSAFTLGTGLLMSTFAVFFGDMVNVYTFLLRLLFFLSGIFYLVESLDPILQKVVYITPTYHLIELFRSPIYAGQLPSTFSIVYSFIWAVIAFFFGFWYFTKRSHEFVYRV